VLSGRRHSGRADRHGLPSSRQIRRPRSSRWPKRESAHAWSGGRGRDGGAGSQGQDGVAASRGVEEEEGGDVRSRGRRRRRRVPGLGGIAGGWVAVRGFGEEWIGLDGGLLLGQLQMCCLQFGSYSVLR
jgi:hypothetical protein